MVTPHDISTIKPYLITQSDRGCLLHTGELTSVKSNRQLEPEDLRIIETLKIPFINYSTGTTSSELNILEYPGFSPYIHPGPYSPLDLAPVELIGNLARKDGFEVANVRELSIPGALLRRVDSVAPNRPDNVNAYSLPSAQSGNRAMGALLLWGDHLRSVVVSEGQLSEAPDARAKTKAFHRAYGVVFYHAHLASAGNYSGEQAWGEVVKSLSDWVDKLSKVAREYPESGRADVLDGHRHAVAHMTELRNVAVSKERTHAIEGPDRKP